MPFSVQGPLLERESELARLAALLAAARAGQGGLAVIEGPPGIGKTRLLEAARGAAAQAGMEVLGGRGGDLEPDLPFGVVRQLFELRVRRSGPALEESLLTGPAALARTALLSVGVSDGGARAPDPAYAVLHGLYWLTSNLAERAPLVLLIDDAHWSDQPSLRFLHYLASRVHDLPVLLVVTLRTADPEARDELVARLRAEPAAALLRPSPLSPGAVASLVRDRLAPEAAPAFCDACHAATNGNPFLVRELLAELTDTGVSPSSQEAARVARLVPDAVARQVLARLARLTSESRSLAGAVAVLGADVGLGVAGRLAGLDADGAAAAADLLAQAELLRPRTPLEFVHPLVREAIRADLAPGERAASHRRAAEFLEEAGAGPDRVAAQLIATGPVGEPWALDALRSAADAALSRGAPESAVSSLRRALDEPLDEAARAEVLFHLGRAEAVISGPAATDRLLQALEATREPVRRARIAELLSRRLFFDARPDDAVSVTSRALDELPDADPELRARLETELLNNAVVEPSMTPLAARLAEGARRIDRPSGLGTSALVAVGAYWDCRAGAPAADVVHRARLALESGELIAMDNGGPGFMGASVVLVVADSQRALETQASALAAAQESGNVFGFAAAKLLGCFARLARGELVDAIADGTEALEASEAYELRIGPPYACAFLAGALMEAGDLDGAHRALERARVQEVPESAHWHWFLDSRARLRALRGDARGALAETLECGRRFETVGGRNPAWIAWRSRAALCLTALGEEPERARALVEEELALAEAFGAPRALGRALRVRVS